MILMIVSLRWMGCNMFDVWFLAATCLTFASVAFTEKSNGHGGFGMSLERRDIPPVWFQGLCVRLVGSGGPKCPCGRWLTSFRTRELDQNGAELCSFD